MYRNRYTVSNPGLVIILVDQSASMSQPFGGKNRAECAANAINHFIQDIIAKCVCGIDVRDKVKIVVIGYGCEKGNNAYVIVKGSNKELVDSPLRIESITKRFPDGVGGLVEIKSSAAIWVEPKAVGGTPMASAFELTHQVINEWINTRQKLGVNVIEDDPIPIIINITDGMPNDGEENVRENVQKIKSIAFLDGNPILINIHLSESVLQTIFPNVPPTDLCGSFIYDISSELPEEWKSWAKFNELPFDGNRKMCVTCCGDDHLLAQTMCFISELGFFPIISQYQ